MRFAVGRQRLESRPLVRRLGVSRVPFGWTGNAQPRSAAAKSARSLGARAWAGSKFAFEGSLLMLRSSVHVPEKSGRTTVGEAPWGGVMRS